MRDGVEREDQAALHARVAELEAEVTRLERTAEAAEISLVLAELDRPPLVGDAVEYDGVRFEVTEVEGHGVRQAVVTTVRPPLPGPPE